MIRLFWLSAAFTGMLMVEAQGGDAKKEQDKKPMPPVYYPLKIGNRWEYDLTANGSQSKMILRIAKTETIDGIPLMVLEAEVNGQVAATEHLRETAEGILRYRMNQFVPDPPFLLLKFPVKSGMKWDGAFKAGQAKATYASETAEETVEVPAGKFKTIRVAI